MKYNCERWNMKEHEKEFTLIDAFAGGGIGKIGLMLAGFKTKYAFDYNENAVKSYNLNLGNENDIEAVVRDANKLREDNYKELPKNVDLMVGGFPCKSYSNNGARRGKEDKKYGNLAEIFAEMVEYVNPKSFAFENVGGLIDKKNLEHFNYIIKKLRDYGYDIFYFEKNGKPQVINMWEYGVPQKRNRIIVVGFKKEFKIDFKFPDIVSEDDRKNIRYAIGDLPEPNMEKNHYGYGLRKDELPFIEKVNIGGNWKDLPIEDQKTFMGGAFNSEGGKTSFLRKTDFNNPCWTITGTMSGKNSSQIIDNHDKYNLNRPEVDSYEYNEFINSKNLIPYFENRFLDKIKSIEELGFKSFLGDKDNYYYRNNIQPPRRFTVREAMRLQTIPDWYVFPDELKLKEQYEIVGNGIPSLFMYKLGLKIKEYLKTI